MKDLLWLIPALPFAGAALNGAIALFRRWTPGDPTAHGTHEAHEAHEAHAAQDDHAHHAVPGAYAGWIASAAMLAAFAVAVASFLELTGLRVEQRALQAELFPWISVGLVDIRAGLLFDPLSGLLALVVTGVGFLIHVYSVAYMSHDENRDRYFTWLNLFAGMMLILVLGDSLPLLFVGWEGVGLCSYLLIGFWYTDLAKAKAGKKAFVVNRIGDFGFLLGMFTLFAAAPGVEIGRTLSFESLHHLLPDLQTSGMITAACLLLFVGACGKSAQFPLYLWLPDAMAGPTPVSALIHAATMVTAGVYMMARLSFLFSESTTACVVIACVGAFTALFAATMGFVQNDVKKVLAYSTVSQLGFMVLAIGVGAYSAAIFHLTTHAFFKALLFLGSGSLIHAMEHALPPGRDPNDIRSMGNMRKYMPITFVTFLCGWVAIIGFPGTSGFFSKDEILASVLHSQQVPHGLAVVLFAMGWLAAVATAFYMTRLVVLVFFGKPRMGAENESKVHESAPLMWVPMAVLAALSIGAGWLWMPHVHVEPFREWLDPVFHGALANAHHAEPSALAVWGPTGAATLAMAIGVALAWFLYVAHPERPALLAARFRRTYGTLTAKFWIDELAEGLFVTPVHRVSRGFLWRGIDAGLIDGAVNGAGHAARRGAAFVSRLQTGLVQNYAVGITVGVAAISLYLLRKFYV